MSEKTHTHLVAGFAGGLTSAVILQPFDLLKTRLQQASHAGGGGGAAGGNKHKKLMSIIRKDFSSVKQLWTGTLPSVLRTSIGSSLYLTSLSASRTYLSRRRSSRAGRQDTSGGASTGASTSTLPKLTMYENLLTGAAMRGVVGFLTMPVTVIKTRFESNMYHYRSLGEAAKDIYREQHNSVRGFFLGCGSTIVRDAPYAGLYVLMYEQFKVSIGALLGQEGAAQKHSRDNVKAVAVNSSSAMSAASLATMITTPFDTIKTRIQVSPQQYTSFAQTFASIVRQEGASVLFRGAGLRLVRKTLSAGIAWGIYEELLKFF